MVVNIVMKCMIPLVFLAFFIGSVRTSLHSRIIGGEDAEIQNFPYDASLRVKGTHFCGGCIISDRHILTAAHCLTNKKGVAAPYADVTVNTGTSSSKEIGHSYGVATVKIHPEWTGTDEFYFNDIAVLTLVGKIRFYQCQQKVRLPIRDLVSGSKALITGWGRTGSEKRSRATQLQKLEMTLLTKANCQSVLPADVTINAKQLCGYNACQGQGSSLGDSGGPVVSDNQVVGIISWVLDGKFANGAPEIYTNVYAYKDFIESVINN